MTAFYNAQKALAAFKERYELCGPFDDDWVEQCLAAALEDVADQVVPENAEAVGDKHDDARADQWMRIRYKLLAITAELRGTTNTQEHN